MKTRSHTPENPECPGCEGGCLHCQELNLRDEPTLTMVEAEAVMHEHEKQEWYNRDQEMSPASRAFWRMRSRR